MRSKNLVILFCTAFVFLFSFLSASAQQIQPGALRQIQSLIDEKEARSPAQKKLDSQLWYAIKQERGERITPEVVTLEVNVRKDNSGLVPVDIRCNVTRALLKTINEAGGEIIFQSQNLTTINARIPLLALEQIAALEDVRFIYPADRAYTHTNDEAPGFPNLGMNGKPRIDALTIYDRKPFVNSFDSKYDNRNKATTPFKFDIPPVGNYHVDFTTRAARVRKQLSNALSDKKFRHDLPTGPINSEADVTHRAAEARAFFGVTGAGIKIGVLSNGVASLAAQQAAGELPAVTVLPGQAGSGDEGTAMLELIYDLAPGAQLFFATANTSQASFAQNILDLRTAGCDIIVDDVAYFREAAFQDDNVAVSVNTVTAAGALYFSSAGNEGNKDDNTSGVWEGDFLDAGTGTVGAVVIAGGTVHNFGGGVLNDQITTSNGGGPIGLFWSDQLGASGNDYDLYILDAGLTTVVNAATNIQDGNDDPVELSTISPAAGRRLVIFKKTGAALRALHLNTFRGRLAINTTGQTHGHSAAVDAFSVAATPAAGAIGAAPNPTGPYPGVFSASNLTEIFSSDGPRRIFYNPNGTAITPGNFLFGTAGGNIRQKPDITAADGTATGVGGFNPFYGTSAAAPHAAAIAALIKSAVPAITPAQVRTALVSSAIDIEVAGYDRDAGSGIIMAYEALVAAGASPVPHIVPGTTTLIAESCTPANTGVDPGETVTISFCVQNTGGANTANLVGTLQATGGITSPSGPQNYGIVVASGPSICRNFTFTASGACGSTITASIQFQDGATNLGTITYTFTLGLASSSGPTTFSNITAITIPTSGAATPYPSNITVSGMTGTVSKVTVNLTGLNHAFPEDVAMLLVGPGGQKFVILDGVIGGTPWVNINYTLDDAAAANIPKPATPASGTFKPTCYFAGDVFPAPAPPGANAQPAPAGSATFASVFNGINPNGSWSLYIYDFAAGDGGSISGGWGLNITTTTYSCCTPPPCLITCPANITVPNDANQCGAVVTYPAPTTSGTCGPVTSSPASGSFFPVGTTTVTASDPGGATCSFTVTVQDTQAPAVTCPANITVPNDANQCGAVVTFILPTATDNCPGVTVSASPASGSFFAVGTTTVTVTASDASANSPNTTCTFTVTVQDTQAPAVTCPANITVPNAANQCGAVVTFTLPTATDNCAGVTVSASPTSGSFFAVGTTTVTITASDASVNSPNTTCTFTVTVQDTQIPTITCPAAVTVSCANAVPTVNTGSVTATDNCSGVTVSFISDVISAQTCANRYTLTRTYRATDAAGNIANCTQIITVNDVTPPTITCPATVTVSCASAVPAVNIASVTATDNCTGAITITHMGDVISNQTCANKYTITRTYRATDVCGNFAECTQIITVNDLTPPTITCPAAVNVSCASAVPAPNIASVTATDNCTGAVTIIHIGDVISNQTCANKYTITRTYRATDVCGNFAQCTQIITVNDQTAPTITCPANITVTSTVGSCTIPVSFTVTATDNCGTVTIASSPASGSNFSVGTTTVTSTATDACGNFSTCTFTVTVLDAQLPVITVQPVNVTACAGGTAIFSVTATNAVSYQWQQFNGTSFVNIPGATAASLTLTGLTMSMNASSYRVNVIGLCTTIPSGSASLQVFPLPTISLTLSRTPILLPGQSLDITAVVSPGGGSFVWFKNGVVMPGITGNSLSGLTVADIGTYRVRYTDINGCVVTSVDITVSGQPSDNLYVYPNPNTGHFVVRYFNIVNEPVTVILYDEKGAKVYSKSFITTTTYSGLDIDISNLSQGKYLVQVVNSAGKIIGAKWVIVIH